MQKLISDLNLKNILKKIVKRSDEQWYTTDKRIEAFSLHANVSDAPIGTIIDVIATTPPDSYIVCDGTEYPVTGKYSNLAAYIYTQYGSMNHFGGDGETTFAVPNLPSDNPDILRCIRAFPFLSKLPIMLSDYTYVIYVDPENGDDTNDGLSIEYALKTIKSAVLQCPTSGKNCIIMLQGTHILSSLTNSIGANYHNYAVCDCDKPIHFVGMGKDTILYYNGLNATLRDKHAVGFANSYSCLMNCHFKYDYKVGGTNYNRALLGHGFNNCKNVYFENTSGVTVSAAYDNQGREYTVENCTFRFVSLTGDYSGNPTYKNCCFDATPSRGTKTNCVTKTFIASDLYADTISEDLKLKGLTSSNEATHIGVAGGTYPWESG